MMMMTRIPQMQIADIAAESGISCAGPLNEPYRLVVCLPLAHLIFQLHITPS